MKKYLILALICLSANLYASKIVSKERNFFDKILISKNVEDKINGRFDYEKDIAVVSDQKFSKISSEEDAQQGLYSIITSYAYEDLKEYLNRANLVGPGFNEYQMSIFSKDVANKVINQELYTVAGVWQDTKTKNYYTLLKIEKSKIEQYDKEIFKERLAKIIQELKKLKEGI